MKFGIAVSTFPTLFGPIMFSGDLAQKLDVVSDLGYAGIDLFIKSADEPGLDQVVKAIRRNRLQVVIIAAVSAFVDDGLFLSSPDADVRQKMIARMRGQIALASELGAMVPIGVLRGSEGGAERLKWLADSLLQLLDIADEHGVRLLIEPVNRYETRMINSIPDAFDFLTQFGMPNLGLLVDVFHMNIEDRDIYASLRMAGDRIGHVHVADSNRRVPGYGHLDWSAIFQTLNGVDYQGFCSIEAIPGEDARQDAAAGIQFLRTTFATTTHSS
jgi:sugar phosphate isomerase/epimerase